MSEDRTANPFQSPTEAPSVGDVIVEEFPVRPRRVTAVVYGTYLLSAYVFWQAGRCAWDGYEMLHSDGDLGSQIFGEIVLAIAAIVLLVALVYLFVAVGMSLRQRWGRVLGMVVAPFTVVPLLMGLGDGQVPGIEAWLCAAFGVSAFAILWSKKCRDYYLARRTYR